MRGSAAADFGGMALAQSYGMGRIPAGILWISVCASCVPAVGEAPPTMDPPASTSGDNAPVLPPPGTPKCGGETLALAPVPDPNLLLVVDASGSMSWRDCNPYTGQCVYDARKWNAMFGAISQL